MTRKTIILCAVLALSQAAFAQKFIADKVVAVVGSQPILYSEVKAQAAQMTEEYRRQNYTSDRDPMDEALEALLEQKLLYSQSQIDSIDISGYAGRIAEMVRATTDGMIAEAGSIMALEAREHKPLYSIKEKMRNQYEEYFGANEMRSHVQRQVKMTPGEVDRFYRDIDHDSLPVIPEQYVYAQITKFPKSAEIARQRTRERLLELRQRIIEGERFDRLAVIYSLDGGSAMRGGEMDPAPKESFVEPFAVAAAKLRPGQVSGVVETEYGFHIIQLIDKPSENLYHLRHILLKPTYTTDEQIETLDFLDSLAGVIRAGGITFERAAQLHSDDAASKMNGGVVSNQDMLFRYYGDSDPAKTRTRFAKDDLEPSDASHLVRMSQGEISRAFMGRDFRMNEMGKILRLNEIVPSHTANLSEDWLDIEQMALARKQTAHYRKWLDSKIDEMYVRIDPMFKRENFANKRWFK
jgi:peptidyl-prolyl cis-trans isomerase SurA